MLAAGVLTADAYSLLGPLNEPYQVPEIGYDPNVFIDTLPAGPKNLGEEYRRNTPVLYYSFDQNFLDYFGSAGAAAVDAAIAVMNGLAQTNISAYSPDLSEFPLEAARVNYPAQALALSDIKSTTLTLLVEQMGLANPDRYVWTMHSREHFGTVPCPVGQQYLIIKRNFDPVPSAPNQPQPSSYINGTLYTYLIWEFCTTANSPIPPLVADASEYPVDPLATTFTAIASGFLAPITFGGFAFGLNAGLGDGIYYTGLTRDDVGGLRYLLRTNNMNIENAGADTFTYVTNNNALQLLYSSNLTLFASQALTNDAATLIGLYPGLLIANSTPYFVNVATTNPVFYFTNYPWDPYGTAAHLASLNVLSTNAEIRYNHEFVNIVTNQYRTSSTVTLLTTNISTAACPPATPYGTICASVTASSTTTNFLTGGFYIIPPNLCSVQIVSTQLINTVYVTNSVLVATNAGSTNLFGQFFSQTLVYSWQQYIYLIHPVTCPTNSVALRQGIERVRFVRRDFDSLLGQFFYPTNSDYVLNAITNSTVLPQSVRRSVTSPDILFTAADLTGGSGSTTLNPVVRNVPFVTANTLPGLAGPGTIDPNTQITFNKVGPIYGNVYPGLGEDTQIPILIWGSFDGSTNAPVVYPNGTSIYDLENQVLIQVGPAGTDLPNGRLGVNYTNAFSGFTVSGGTPPYVWSLGPNSAGLPWGLTLNAGTGKISGVPLSQGTYDFTVRLTESGGRFVDRAYAITVTP